VTTTEERVTVAEQYARATTSGDLRQAADHRTDADVLLAAGIAAGKDERRKLALKIYRMGVTGSLEGLGDVIHACDDWMSGYLQKKHGGRVMPQRAREALVTDVLKWYMNPTCDYCDGTAVIAAEGTAGRLTEQCPACHGTGKKSLARAVPHTHIKPAEWLAMQIQQRAALIHAEMAKLLSTRIKDAGL